MTRFIAAVMVVSIFSPRPASAQVDPKVMLIGAAVALTAWGAQEADKTPAFPTHHERLAADVSSWLTAGTSVALDTRASWQCADRRRCLELEGARISVTYAAVFAAKLLIHRKRPCAPDCGLDKADQSFFSGHAALAFSTVGGAKLLLTVPLAVGTGALRVAAGKHFVTDTIVGALVGLGASRIR